MGSKYTVFLKNQAKKVLSSINNNDKKLILKKIVQLETDPYKDAKKLEGSHFWRVRAGDFRIVYTVEKDILTVLVVRIGNRKDVYKVF